jgi:hypothetical protein
VSGPAVTITPVPTNHAPGELTRLAYATAAAVGTLRMQASATISGSLVQSNAVDIVVSAAPTPPPPPPPPPPAAPGDIVALSINSAAAGALPWTVGHAFRKGDVPSGAAVTSAAGPIEVDVLTTWDDGSARTTRISGLTPAGAVVLTRGGTPPSGTPVPEPTDDISVTITNLCDWSFAPGASYTVGLTFSPGSGVTPTAPLLTASAGSVSGVTLTADPDGIRWHVTATLSLSGVSAGAVVLVTAGLTWGGTNWTDSWRALVRAGGGISWDAATRRMVPDAAQVPLIASQTVTLASARAAGATAWDRTTPRRMRLAQGVVATVAHYYAPTQADHLTVWWEVIAYSDGRREVDTRIENGWFRVANPGTYVYDIVVTVGGTTRYTGTRLYHHHHTSWSRLDWIGTDPAVTPGHDVRYLQSTKLLPTLGVRSLPSFAAYASARDQAERGTPFELGFVDPALGSGGFTDNAGLLPAWEAAYLVSGDPGCYWSTLRCARHAAGRFHTHYRDELTGRPVRGSQFLTWGINSYKSQISDNAGNGASNTPAPLGLANGPQWFFTHGPGFGYLAHLLTGRWGFAEELQHYNAVADLYQTQNVAGGYRISPFIVQLRAHAWVFRHRAMSALVQPRRFGGALLTGADADQVTEALGRLNADIDYYAAQYLPGGAGSDTPSTVRDNALGYWFHQDYFEDSDPNTRAAGGMFWAYNAIAVLWAFDAEASVSTNFSGLAAFTARYPIGALGAAPGTRLRDWRFYTGYQLSVWSATGLDASWDANWTRITSTITWPGGNPDSVAEDNRLHQLATFGTGEWTARTQFTESSDELAMIAAVAIAHQIHASGRLTIPGAQLMAGRFYESDTWRNSVAAGGFLRTAPRHAAWAFQSRHYANLDDATTVLDMIAARVAASPGADAWLRLDIGATDATKEFQDAWPPIDLRDNSISSGDHLNYIIPAWGGATWVDWAMSLVIDGGGHANSSATEVFGAPMRTRQWALGYYGAQAVAVSGFPQYRSKDFNATPISTHPYGNKTLQLQRGDVLHFGGAAHGDGGAWQVYDPAIPGFQSPLRAAGAYALDLAQMYQGKVAGATGSNAARGAFAGTSLPGANAWTLLDWYSQAGAPARPTWVGSGNRVGAGTVTRIENGHDTTYWTSGNRRVGRVQRRTTDWRDDIHQQVADQGDADVGRTEGVIALDPVRDVLLQTMTGTVQPVLQQCDLKRPWGTGNGWRNITLTGPDLAEFLTIGTNRRNAGLIYNPRAAAFDLWVFGRQIWRITPPAGSPTPDTGWTVTKVPMATGAAPPESFDGDDAGALGKFVWARALGVSMAVYHRTRGEIWACAPAGWTDPRSA